MKRIIGIVAALLVLGTCWNAEGQSKGQENIQDNAQSNSQDQTQDINELIRECRRLESSGKTKEAAEAAIGYLEVGGICGHLRTGGKEWCFGAQEEPLHARGGKE